MPKIPLSLGQAHDVVQHDDTVLESTTGNHAASPGRTR
jgi:hypothetical protein